MPCGIRLARVRGMTMPTTPISPSAGRTNGIERSDEDLLRDCAAGDESALALVLRRHGGLIRAIAQRVLNSDGESDDIVNDVLLEVWQQAHRFQEAKGSALAWVSTLARRRAIDRLRRKQAYLRARARYETEAGVSADVLTPKSADGNAIEGDRAAALQQLLSTLPPPQQQALELAFYQGLSQRQIAALTGIPLGTIKTRLELALKKIRVAAASPNGGVAEWAYTMA